MALDPRRLLAYRYPEVEQDLSARDAILYALAVGYGGDPLDQAQLRFVYERALQVAPTMAITLCYPGELQRFAREVGIRPESVLHVSQSFRLLRPLPVTARLRGRTRITAVYDKGAERGALWTYRNEVVDRDTGEVLCELDAASMARGYGGWGGPRGEAPAAWRLPARAADAVVELPTRPDAALLYRLSGDWNPLHVDPEAARRGGFERPILHGRCTFGVAGHAILRAICDYDALRLRGMSARFAAPVYPGETIRTEIWRESGGVLFRCLARERGLLVLDAGRAELAQADAGADGAAH